MPYLCNPLVQVVFFSDKENMNSNKIQVKDSRIGSHHSEIVRLMYDFLARINE